METLELKLKNIKCDGCVANIKEALKVFNNIETVDVNKENGMVSITGSSLQKKILVDKLTAIGYPQKTIFN